MNANYIPLQDPFRYQWFFFLNQHARDDKTSRRYKIDTFKKLLEQAWQWAGGTLPLPEIPLKFFQLSRISHRLAFRPWQEINGILRTLEARTLLDCFYLQLGKAFRGSTSLQALTQLAPYTLSTNGLNIDQEAYLGESTCLGAILGDEKLPANWPEIARDILHQEEPDLKKLYNSEKIRETALPIAGSIALLVTEGEKEIMILLYPRKQENEISRFIYFLAPQLWLNRLKYRFIYHRYNKSLYRSTQELERHLDALLKQGFDTKLKLKELEDLSTEISRCQADFIESVSMIEETQESLRVSLRNMHLLLEDPIWESRDQERAHVLWDDMELFLKQVETDLHFWEITRQQSELALQNLLTVVGVREVQWERWITMILLFFAAIGLVQVFPSSPIPLVSDNCWKIGFIVLGGLVVLLASLLPGRR